MTVARSLPAVSVQTLPRAVQLMSVAVTSADDVMLKRTRRRLDGKPVDDRIVGVHDLDTIVREVVEEPHLGGDVRLHGPVVVEMVARHVREHGRPGTRRHPRGAGRGCATTLPWRRAGSPRRRAARSTRCSSMTPGVVSPLPPGTTSPSLPRSTPSVPMDAAGAAVSLSRCRSRPTVVVFPLVPVTPTIVRRAAGSPNAARAATAAARRASSHDKRGQAAAATDPRRSPPRRPRPRAAAR